MNKYVIKNEQDLYNLRVALTKFAVGDIITHKELEYPVMVGMMKIHFPEVELFPVSPGTDAYTINGYNTSAIKSINPEILE